MSFAGKKVGNVWVMRRGHGRSWICICSCGKETNIEQRDLLSFSCDHSGRSRRHPVYMIWKGMKSRCYVETDSSYIRYGAKGIRVDPEWHNFANFFRDIGHTWKKGDTLDRIDGSKNYGPGNCRWATVKEQNNNRSVNRQILYNGKVYTLAQLVEHFGVVSYKTASARVNKYGFDPIRAASTPVK